MPTKRGKEGSFRCGMTAISSRETPLSDFLDSFKAKFAEFMFHALGHLGNGSLQTMLARRVGFSTRNLLPPIFDQECRSQGACECDPDADHHHCSEPGDKRLVYGPLDVRRRCRLHPLRRLGRPQIVLLRLYLATNLPAQVHAV